MATGDIRKGIDNLTKSKSNTLNRKQLQEIEREKLRLRKKGIQDEEQLERKAIDNIEKYRDSKRRQSLKELFQQEKEYYDRLSTQANTLSEKISSTLKSISYNLLENASNLINNTYSSVNTGINSYLGTYSKYMSSIEARIQGSNKTYSGMLDLISGNIGASQYVSQKSVIENLNKLVEAGIVYNVEQRAFLETISDKIATTFDSFDSSLMQLIRIQQADSTSARLGLEASLTQFFNNTFQDSSYLSTVFDAVTSAILQASSQMNYQDSVEFEYVVQKWLGSLSSVGVNNNTLTNIAQGIGYLGSGDINALSSNNQLQNLLIMAANKSGLDYASLLTEGLNASNINQLLYGLIQFGQEIASNENIVVKSQYAQLFGMTVSDLTSLLNLSSQDLVEISKNMLTYSNAIEETSRQLNLVSSRTPVSERIENLFSNILSSIGENIASSPSTYATWLLTDLVQNATGGINIPSVLTLGSGITNLGTVEGWIKAGIVGLSTLGEVGTILAGLSGRNNLSLLDWGSQETLSRGKGFTTAFTESNITSSLSSTTYIGNTSGSDIYQGSLTSAKDQASETIVSNEESSDRLLEILEEDIASDIKTIISILSTDGIVVKAMPFGYLGGV